jgi:UDP-N-acetylglucosamine 2-epimerase (non-hydrolysing)/UDP-GlcNAc3NAcA epimerase
MIDVAFKWQSTGPATSEVLAAYDLTPGSYLLLTAHRAGNVDDPGRLRMLVDVVAALPGRVIFPMHPRTRLRLHETNLLEQLEMLDGVVLTEPLGYVGFGALLRSAHAVLTDSGGVQKEAYLAGVPCITLRSTTEWVETVDTGWNTLVDLDGERALESLERPIPKNHPQLYGDGKAAGRCVAAIGRLAR